MVAKQIFAIIHIVLGDDKFVVFRLQNTMIAFKLAQREFAN